MTDYKERIKTEYRELKERCEKLNKMLVKHEAGTLDFKPASPIGLLENQLHYMQKYLRTLQIRAEHEKIDLDEEDDLEDDE